MLLILIMKGLELMLRLTTQSFKSELQKSPAPAVVMFYAPWCGTCAMMRPIVENLEKRCQKKYPGKLRFFEVDTTASELLMAQYQIDLLPTFLLFQNQQILAVMQGMIPEQEFESRLLQFIDHR